jgi:hypothetical protein
MVNLLIFGNPSGIQTIISKLYRVTNDLNIGDFSYPKNIVLWKNGNKLLTNESINFLPYTILVVINSDENINTSLEYWSSKLKNYGKRIVYCYNILSNDNNIDIDSHNIELCMINSNYDNMHEVIYLLSLINK